MKSKPLILLAAVIAALVIAGCGDDKNTTSTDTTATEATGSTAETGADSGTPGKPPKVTGSLSKKPVIATPEGGPPPELIVKDIKKGTGKKARKGDSVKVQYVGVNWSTGKEFDASWTNGRAFYFVLGDGMVIPGWDEGVVGMRVGGRRLLVIPPEKGYGAQGQGTAIPPNETLVFVVDLEAVQKGDHGR